MCDSEEDKYWQDFIEGDLNALSVLFLHYAKGLVSYGMKICPDEELVKDSIQEVFILLILKKSTLKHNDNIKGFVYRLLRNKMMDEIKRKSRSKKIDNLIFDAGCCSEMDVEHHLIGLEEESRRNDLLTSALNQLSAHQKEVMFLKYSNGLNYEQISQVMGISIASSRTLLYRTLKQMKASMKI